MRMYIQETFNRLPTGEIETDFYVRIGKKVLIVFFDHESAENFVLENAIFDEYAEICDFGSSKERRIFVQEARQKGYSLKTLYEKSKRFRKTALLDES